MTTDIQTRDLAWARRITELLRVRGTSFAESRQRLLETIHEAQEGEAWRFLDYPSWTAYIADVFKDEPMLLERDARRSISAELHIEGMSVRAIAAVTGKSIGQTHADIAAGVQSLNTSPAPVELTPTPVRTEYVDVTTGEIIDDPQEIPSAVVMEPQGYSVSEEPTAPRTVTGLDGKTYSVPEQPTQQEPRTHRTPITKQMFNAFVEASEAARTLEDLTEDPRFAKNRKEVAAKNRNDLIQTIDALQRVMEALDETAE